MFWLGSLKEGGWGSSPDTYAAASSLGRVPAIIGLALGFASLRVMPARIPPVSRKLHPDLHPALMFAKSVSAMLCTIVHVRHVLDDF